MSEKLGVIAVFYDRKNFREVKNTELCFTNYVVDLARYDDESYKPNKINGFYELVLGELGYKSEKCNTFSNFDLTCMYSDLVFLRFENE
jgi:hypothetical protein